MTDELTNPRIQEYEDALKRGRKAYNKAVSEGRSPYLPSLDSILEHVNVKQEVRLGMVKIPLDRIVGTKTEGRQSGFADNFMPLMDRDSEFGCKWRSVVNYHLDQGIGDPIVAYEYLNKFYVLEGNKRVSVLKYFGGDSIDGNVIRVLPYPDDTNDTKLYYEFLDFYNDSKINYIYFTKLGSFDRLTEAVGKTKGEKWTDDDRMEFSSAFFRFERLFNKNTNDQISITAGDAFLFYLSLYSYEEIQKKLDTEMKVDVDKIKVEFSQIAGTEAVDESVALQPEENNSIATLFSKFMSLTNSSTLEVAFIYDRGIEHSGWSYAHELGRIALEKAFGSRIHTVTYVLEERPEDLETLLEKVIATRPHIVFTTSPAHLPESLRATVKHPEVRILNCSVGYPYMSLRTYYGRMYEAKFLSGLIAGAIADNNRIAYAANYPSYGSLANINAFAIGATMTNPRAEIYLNWKGLENGQPLEDMVREKDIQVVSGYDIIRLGDPNYRYGLHQLTDGDDITLASPVWHWGKFYERIIRDYLQGNWETAAGASKNSAVNYWWGISSGILDLVTVSNLPSGVSRLVSAMKRQIFTESFHPFEGVLTMQDGTLFGTEGEAPSPSELIKMNQLVSNIVGTIPDVSELNEAGRVILKAQSEFGAHTQIPDAVTEAAETEEKEEPGE